MGCYGPGAFGLTFGPGGSWALGEGMDSLFRPHLLENFKFPSFLIINAIDSMRNVRFSSIISNFMIPRILPLKKVLQNLERQHKNSVKQGIVKHLYTCCQKLCQTNP